jgi:4-aminobutyrate aminotransferase-like enzyme
MDLELIVGAVPGPRTAELRAQLQNYESRNVTFFAERFPVFWETANGATVTDVDGQRYIDLTSAFGVANAGHANPTVVAALHEQASRLMHGMGDVHPTEVRARLLERLTQILPRGLTKSFLATTGSEAVEAALKTSVIATGKTRFIAFNGAYHGLSLGALTVCGMPKFRERFRGIAAENATFLDYPRRGIDPVDRAIVQLDAALDADRNVAAVIIEPIQGRGGCIVPPPGYLAAMREVCTRRGALLIFDEIYTGFGRTGEWFAAQREGIAPDIICIGKAMGSGFPISATVARAEIMDAWPLSTGEALHTSTYLGNPMGCAAALATIDELRRLDLPARAKRLGGMLESRLLSLAASRLVVAVRGRGLLWGVQLRSAQAAQQVVTDALARGVILLQAGPDGDVLTITPPLVISEQQLFRAVEIIGDCL